MQVYTSCTQTQFFGSFTFRGGILKRSVFIIVGIVVVDQLTKLIAYNTLRGRPTQHYLGDLWRFQYTENTGAFLSLGASMPPVWRFWIFNVVTGIILIGVGIYLWRSKHTDTFQSLALALLLGGGIGNLIDRIWRGSVIDFMNTGIGWLRTGIFNIADMVIVAGVAMLMLSSFKKDPKPKTSNPKQ